ncbi:MAG: DUF6973 domain-containing protein [Carboxydocellales bacterium]
MLHFLGKKLLIWMVIFYTASLALPSTVFARVTYDETGIYLEKLRHEVQRFQIESQKMVGDLGKKGTTFKFILENLGPRERKVFMSNPAKGMLVVMDASTAATSAEYLYKDLWNGKGDAYRHGLWQGLAAYHTGAEYAKAFGDAHEADFPGSKTQTTMDLFNNSVGRNIGIKKGRTSEITAEVKQGITSGKFLYIKKGKLVSTDK